jgi:hypothetical protein
MTHPLPRRPRLLVAASPAAAQWTDVMEVPATDVHSVFAVGDTIAAGGAPWSTSGTNAGATWSNRRRWLG